LPGGGIRNCCLAQDDIGTAEQNLHDVVTGAKSIEINPTLFQDFVKEIDQRRGLESRKIFPEIYAYIN
jgi:hypothetical protein